MEEKEVKNEVPAPETATGKEPEKQGKEKKELTPQQIQQRTGDRCTCRKDKGGKRNYSILQR